MGRLGICLIRPTLSIRPGEEETPLHLNLATEISGGTRKHADVKRWIEQVRLMRIIRVALSRYEKMCVLHVRKKLSHLQLGSQSDEYG